MITPTTVILITLLITSISAFAGPTMSAYVVPELPYDYDALEPHIDGPTMRFHHDRHHSTYVANLNKATNNNEDNMSILNRMPNALSSAPIRNNGGGHYNHAFFWKIMTPPNKASQTHPSTKLASMIEKSFGSLDSMKATFEAQAAPGAVFGSGWVWMCVNESCEGLTIVGTPNQDNPLMNGVTDKTMIPILGLDVWEHAYYLKYQNRRPDYVKNWWNVINWDKVNENLDYVLKNRQGIPV